MGNCYVIIVFWVLKTEKIEKIEKFIKNVPESVCLNVEYDSEISYLFFKYYKYEIITDWIRVDLGFVSRPNWLIGSFELIDIIELGYLTGYHLGNIDIWSCQK